MIWYKLSSGQVQGFGQFLRQGLSGPAAPPAHLIGPVVDEDRLPAGEVDRPDLAALGVKSKGATPILVDIVDDRLHFAQECGIEKTFNSTSGTAFFFNTK